MVIRKFPAIIIIELKVMNDYGLNNDEFIVVALKSSNMYTLTLPLNIPLRIQQNNNTSIFDDDYFEFEIL